MHQFRHLTTRETLGCQPQVGACQERRGILQHRLRCNRYRHCASSISALVHGVGGGIEVRSVRSDCRTRVCTQ